MMQWETGEPGLASGAHLRGAMRLEVWWRGHLQDRWGNSGNSQNETQHVWGKRLEGERACPRHARRITSSAWRRASRRVFVGQGLRSLTRRTCAGDADAADDAGLAATGAGTGMHCPE